MFRNNKLKLLSIMIIVVVVLFSGCQKKVSKKNDDSKKVVKKQTEKVKKSNEELRKFTKEPLIYNDKSIPVLMYHSVDYEKDNGLRMPKEKFEKQMKYLKDNGYTTLTLDEFYDFLVNNSPIPKKSIVITLDDGYVDNYNNAYPILKKYGLKASIFVITGNIDKDKRTVNSKQIKEMAKNGVMCFSHTVKHDQLDKLSYEKQLDTLKKSKETLENLLNKDSKYIAYPYGKWNEDTIKAVKKLGYTMAVTTEGGWTSKDNGIYTLNRVYVSSLYSMDEFIRRITNPDYNKN
ncbi:polysaccharide deacetylase family protein [Clostridium oceanicum]|uniref:Polysaccharide deacetylase family protein n=1 Tax=Clostridium oceanicum TaxID=1543 RepID=A0ABP3V0E7_9CLOT